MNFKDGQRGALFERSVGGHSEQRDQQQKSHHSLCSKNPFYPDRVFTVSENVIMFGNNVKLINIEFFTLQFLVSATLNTVS